MHVLLSGVVGSVAYGLNHSGSDTDRLGVFAAPTEEFHGLGQPKESIVTTDPDKTLHEAAKAARLMLKCNPTVLEILFLPEDLYEARTELGDSLIDIRSTFLSASRVRSAYLGYAFGQFERLKARGDGSFSSDLRKRTAKHARHLARLVRQGVHVYKTGELQVRLDDPQWYRDFGDRVADGDTDIAYQLLIDAEDELAVAPTPLPEEPDPAPVEAWLLRVRRSFMPVAA